MKNKSLNEILEKYFNTEVGVRTKITLVGDSSPTWIIGKFTDGGKFEIENMSKSINLNLQSNDLRYSEFCYQPEIRSETIKPSHTYIVVPNLLIPNPVGEVDLLTLLDKHYILNSKRLEPAVLNPKILSELRGVLEYALDNYRKIEVSFICTSSKPVIEFTFSGDVPLNSTICCECSYDVAFNTYYGKKQDVTEEIKDFLGK